MLWLRNEVFGAALPHEAAAACSLEPSLSSPSSHSQLRIEDVFAVVDELRRLHHAGETTTTYSTWLATAWHVLEWPEPSARLFWEIVWLLGDNEAAAETEKDDDPSPARRALSCRVEVSDLACFLLIHCRHDPESSQDFSFFEEAWIDRSRDDSDTDSVDSHQGASPEKTPPASPPTSPRRRRSSSKRASLDLCLRARAHAEATRLDWVADRLETLLSLVAGAAEDDEEDTVAAFSAVGGDDDDDEGNRRGVVSKANFDRLRFLIRADGTKTLSEACPLFENKDRVATNLVSAWLTSELRGGSSLFAGRKLVGDTVGQSRTFSCPVAEAVSEGTISVTDARKCTRVIVDDEEATATLFDCRIVGCRDVRAYVLTAARYVDVVGCVDCLVVVGAVSRIVRLIACERTHVVVAAGRAIVSSCLNSRLSLYSPFSPLFDGDNRSCHVAPHCTVYDGIRRHLARARLLPSDDGDQERHPSSPNLWRASLRLSASLNRGSNFALSTSLALPPSDFEIVGAPFATNETVLPFPLPPEYSSVLDAKRERAEMAKRRIAELGGADQAKVEAAAKAAFSKWLVDSRRQRHVLELMQIDDEEADADETTLHGKKDDDVDSQS